MSITLFRQGDPRWSKHLLGENKDEDWNLGKYGCLVTSEAMLVATVIGDIGWTPLRMNDFLLANGGFQGGLLRWPVIPKLFPFIEDHGTTTDLKAVAAWVKDEPNFAVLEVDHGVHFVLLYQVGTIADPIDGKSKKWIVPSYEYTKARLYRFVGGKGGGQSATPVPVTGATNVETKEQAEQRLLHGPGGVDEWINRASELQTQLKAALIENSQLKTLLDGAHGQILTLQTQLATAGLVTEPIPVAANQVELPVTQASSAYITNAVGPTIKQVDAISATEKLHSASAQGYGVFKKATAWFKALVLK